MVFFFIYRRNQYFLDVCLVQAGVEGSAVGLIMPASLPLADRDAIPKPIKRKSLIPESFSSSLPRLRASPRPLPVAELSDLFHLENSLYSTVRTVSRIAQASRPSTQPVTLVNPLSGEYFFLLQCMTLVGEGSTQQIINFLQCMFLVGEGMYRY